MRSAIVFAFGALLAGCTCMTVFGAVLEGRPAQKAIVTEFVASYCHPSTAINESFQLGGAAALSRLAIESGLQPMAWAEYLKCKSGMS
jgi:hypothetical protein